MNVTCTYRRIVYASMQVPLASVSQDGTIATASLGTSPNQSGDRFQYPAPKNGLGYSLSPIRSVPRNVWGQEINEINEIFEVVTARALTQL